MSTERKYVLLALEILQGYIQILYFFISNKTYSKDAVLYMENIQVQSSLRIMIVDEIACDRISTQVKYLTWHGCSHFS